MHYVFNFIRTIHGHREKFIPHSSIHIRIDVRLSRRMHSIVLHHCLHTFVLVKVGHWPVGQVSIITPLRMVVLLFATEK